MFAISFTLFLAGAIGMVGDLSVLYGASANAARAAQDAAIAGAADVDLSYFLNCGGSNPCVNGHGKQVINCVEQTSGTCAYVSTTGGTSRCQTLAQSELTMYSGVTVSCTFVPGYSQQEIQATVTFSVALPIPFVSGNPVVSATYRAAAQAGTTSPIS